jgi:hypothetical protein
MARVAAFGFHDFRHQLVTGAFMDVVEEPLEFGAIFDSLELLVFEPQSLLNHLGDLLFFHGESSFPEVTLERKPEKLIP